MLLTFLPPVFYTDESFYVANVKQTDIVFETDILNLKDDTISIRPTEEALEAVKIELAELLLHETKTWFAQKFTVQSFLKRLQFEFSNFSYDIVNRWVKIKWVPISLKIKTTSFTLVFKVEAVTDCNPRIPSAFLESLTPRAQSPADLEVQDIETIPIASQETNLALNIAEDFKATADTEETYDRAKLKAAIARMKVAKLEAEYIKKYGKVESFHSDSEFEEDEESNSDSEESSELNHS